MKAWQIFGIGVAVLVAALYLPAYEPMLAGVAALLMVGTVAAGFAIRPRKTVFYLRTTLVLHKFDRSRLVEHDRIAVRVEMARLWLLYLPTLAAVAFLVVTSASGTTWKFSVLDRFLNAATTVPYPLVLLLRLSLIVIIGLLATWVNERQVMRHAEACSADYVSHRGGAVSFSFRDRSGEYFGGEGVALSPAQSPELARIVFYSISNPQRNIIAMTCLFHRVTIIGRGLTDLDAETAAAFALRQAASQAV